MEDKSLLLQYMGDTPQLRIIDFFLDNRESDYSKKEIIEYTGISKTTFYNVWDGIMRFGLLKTTRKYGRAQLYALNQDSALIQAFRVLDDELGKHAMERYLKSRFLPNKIAETCPGLPWPFQNQRQQEKRQGHGETLDHAFAATWTVGLDRGQSPVLFHAFSQLPLACGLWRIWSGRPYTSSY